MFLLSRKALSQTNTLSYCLYPFETQQCRKDCIVWWLKRMQSGFCAQLLSRVQLFVTPRTVAHQASLSMGILHARIVAWQPCPPPGDLPNLGIEPRSPALQADSLPADLPGVGFIYIPQCVCVYTFKDSSPLLFSVLYKGHFWLSILYIVVCIC